MAKRIKVYQSDVLKADDEGLPNIPDPELDPGKPEECAGNVERGGFSCDECDHFLKCFPECDPNNEAIDRAADEILQKYRRAFEELAK